MHPKTAAALTELDKSLRQASRLCHRLKRLSQHRPPIYWQLTPVSLHTAQQLVWNLQQEKEQFMSAQQALHIKKRITKKK